MHALIKHLKLKTPHTLIKRLLSILVLFIGLHSLFGCGKRKPPLPPVEKIPQRVVLGGSQMGNKILLTWKMPARNASGSSILNISRADIYRLAEPLGAALSLTEEEFASRSTLITSVPITESDFALKEKTYLDTLQFASQKVRLRYSVRFVNAQGQKAAFSNFLVIEPSSRIARNPSEPSATVGQAFINLGWNAPESNVDDSKPANILGYNLYRFGPGESPRRLNETPLTKTEFQDSFFSFDKTYSYYVRAVSIGSNGEQVESLSSDTLEIIPKDTFPPSRPDAITVAVAPNTISIFFAVNPENDIAGYKIYRSTDPARPRNDWTLLTKELLKTNTYQDQKVEPGKHYYYYLVAVDLFGNESNPSEIVSETAF